MRQRLLAAAALALAGGLAAVACQSDASAVRDTGGRLAYPEARKGSQVDSYHGELVRDPYRWMEEDSAETRAWIEAQNALTAAYLAEIPERDRIRDRLRELWDYERSGLPREEGGRWFWTYNDGLQNQSVLRVTDDLATDGRVLIDPNAWSDDGTLALAGSVPSPDGSRVAYAVSDGGSDWRRWRVRDVATGEDLPDVLTRNKFGGVAWNADGTGLFYASYVRPDTEAAALSAANEPPQIAFHRLGDDEGDDAVVVARTADGISQGFDLSEDERGLFVSRWSAANRHIEIDYGRLAPDGSLVEVAPLIAGYDARYSYVGDDGETAWIRTDLDAPRWRVLAIPLEPAGADDPRAGWREVIPQAEEAIQSVDAIGGRLVVTYLQDACSRMKVFATDGTLEREVRLPGIGSVDGIRGDPDETECFYSFSSFVQPGAVYRLDVASGETSPLWTPSLPFDPRDYVTRQVFYASKDGTRVPLFLTTRQGAEGALPTYLYGYGGFNLSITPFFRVDHFTWVEMGGLLAVASLRGGGEFGEDWHQAGTKEQKQNVFDDFIAAAEWLIDEGWTTRAKLAIGGRSNGGLLVGACLLQRPELYGAALPAVGVMDMLRYHRFTIGWAWAGDYGTVDDAAEFAALRAYSPVHNVRPGTRYPPTLLTTADHDDRVVPAHTYKLTAALQAAQAGPAPILVRIDTRAGHGAGKATAMKIEEAADCWAFAVRELDWEGVP